ncbi:hypothetical protein SDC9_162585 [bioreactor metagenome]|uniref:Uncharacterized protein n=2 Tax=root TaxID=1 RepID=A0A645FLH2_9ZZZZ
MRDMDALYRENREEFDKIASEIANVRRKNYQTKGVYY